MYLTKTRRIPKAATTSECIARLCLLCESDYSDFASHVNVYCYRYPCGRIKLVVPGMGMFFTGVDSNALSSVVFDSIRSLYHVNGVYIHTDIAAVYATLGVRPYGIK